MIFISKNQFKITKATRDADTFEITKEIAWNGEKLNQNWMEHAGNVKNLDWCKSK